MRSSGGSGGRTGSSRLQWRWLLAVACVALLALANIVPWYYLQRHHDAARGAGTVHDPHSNLFDGSTARNAQKHDHSEGNESPSSIGGDEGRDGEKAGDGNPRPSGGPSKGASGGTLDDDTDHVTVAELLRGGYSHLVAQQSSSSNTNEKKSNEGSDGASAVASSVAVPRVAPPYDAHRPGRVCDPLAANVSMAALLREAHPIGTAQEFWYTGDVTDTAEDVTNHDSPAAAAEAARRVLAMRPSRPAGATTPPYAYVLMISNHKYVDGALVVGHSLRQHSEKLRRGDADLVLIISEKIKMSSIRLLTRVFTRVKVMYSMGTHAPKSYYKTTFDKMYLFWLTEYRLVMFLDADSLITANPDGLLDDKEAEGTGAHRRRHRHHHHGDDDAVATPLTAVGGGDYFQTALLVARPDRQLFADLYLEFRLGAFGYNQWRARDGILLRTCFMPHHSNMEHPVDRLYHFYGFVKPWFNKDVTYKYGKNDEKLHFNKQYADWWQRYERLHLVYFRAIAAAEKRQEEQQQLKSSSSSSSSLGYYSQYVYGGSANFPTPEVPIPGLGLAHPRTGERITGNRKITGSVAKFDVLKVKRKDYPRFYDLAPSPATSGEARLVTELVSPDDYMWVQRYSIGSEYFRPTFARYASIRNITLPPSAVVVVADAEGTSCDAVCAAQAGAGKTCNEALLSATAVNDCFFGGTTPSADTANTLKGDGRQQALDAALYGGLGVERRGATGGPVAMAGGRLCDVCTYDFKSNAAPFVTTQSVKQKQAKGSAASLSGGTVCAVNFLHETTPSATSTAPLCNATQAGARRVCVCGVKVKVGKISSMPVVEPLSQKKITTPAADSDDSFSFDEDEDGTLSVGATPPARRDMDSESDHRSASRRARKNGSAASPAGIAAMPSRDEHSTFLSISDIHSPPPMNIRKSTATPHRPGIDPMTPITTTTSTSTAGHRSAAAVSPAAVPLPRFPRLETEDAFDAKYDQAPLLNIGFLQESLAAATATARSAAAASPGAFSLASTASRGPTDLLSLTLQSMQSKKSGWRRFGSTVASLSSLGRYDDGFFDEGFSLSSSSRQTNPNRRVSSTSQATPSGGTGTDAAFEQSLEALGGLGDYSAAAHSPLGLPVEGYPPSGQPQPQPSVMMASTSTSLGGRGSVSPVLSHAEIEQKQEAIRRNRNRRNVFLSGVSESDVVAATAGKNGEPPTSTTATMTPAPPPPRPLSANLAKDVLQFHHATMATAAAQKEQQTQQQPSNTDVVRLGHMMSVTTPPPAPVALSAKPTIPISLLGLVSSSTSTSTSASASPQAPITPQPPSTTAPGSQHFHPLHNATSTSPPTPQGSPSGRPQYVLFNNRLVTTAERDAAVADAELKRTASRSAAADAFAHGGNGRRRLQHVEGPQPQALLIPAAQPTPVLSPSPPREHQHNTPQRPRPVHLRPLPRPASTN